MSEIEKEPSGKSNSLLQVGANIFKLLWFDAFTRVVNS